MMARLTYPRAGMLNSADTRRSVAFAIAALMVYLASFEVIQKRPNHLPGMSQTHFVMLADAFLHGRLHLNAEQAKGLTELIPDGRGGYGVVYPPMPAVMLIPFVAVFGAHFPAWVFSIGLGACCVGLMYRLLRQMRFNSSVSAWVTGLFGFGTSFWYTALAGSPWFLAHIAATFFLVLALLEAYGARRMWLTGMYLGAATLSRLPVLFAVAFFLWLLRRERIATPGRVAALLCGLGLFIGLDVAYDWVRFGVLDAGYDLIPGVLNEPWYRENIFSLSYLPRNVYALLFQSPVLINAFPYLVPTTFGLSLFFTTPAFLLMFLAPGDSLTYASALTAGLVAIPSLLHGWPGGAQFGYRFSLDYTPLLLLLVAQGLRGCVSPRAQVLIVLSCAVSVWGLLFATWIPPAWLFPLPS